jgi:hypothetical protein
VRERCGPLAAADDADAACVVLAASHVGTFVCGPASMVEAVERQCLDPYCESAYPLLVSVLLHRLMCVCRGVFIARSCQAESPTCALTCTRRPSSCDASCLPQRLSLALFLSLVCVCFPDCGLHARA